MLSLSAAEQPVGTKVWDFYTGEKIQSSPAIGQHGILYFGSDNGKLYSFYPDGRGIWEYPTGDRIVGSPAIAADGTVIFGSTDGILYAVEPGGVERWRFQANGPIASSPAIGPDGIVVFGSMSQRLFAVRADGSKLWDLESSSPIVGSPAIAGPAVIVAGSDGTVAAIDVRRGDIMWQFEAPNSIVSSPAIGANATIYFGCFDGHLYALSSTGKKLWTYATGAPVKSSPVIGPDGVIYVGSDDKLLYALAPDGFKKWTFSVGAPIRSTPAVASDGTVYVGSYDRTLYAISPTGTKQWQFVTDMSVSSSPAIGADGTVYFGGGNGRFYAVKGNAGLAGGQWPRFRGNAAQNGYRGSTQAAPTATPVSVAANTPAAPAKSPTTSTAKRSGRGGWWSDVFGPESVTARNRGMINLAGGSRPVASSVKTSDPKVISDARDLMNVSGETPTTVVTSAPPAASVQTPVAMGTETIAAVPTTPAAATTVAPQPVATTSSGALPMMTLVNATPSAPVVTTVPSTTITTPPVREIPTVQPAPSNVPPPVATIPPARSVTSGTGTTMQMINVSAAPNTPPVSARETPVATPAVTPAPTTPPPPVTAPISTPDANGRLPMMRLIESGSARSSSATSESEVSTITFGSSSTQVLTQSTTTEIAGGEPVVEVSALETKVEKSAAPAPKPAKPVNVSAKIREAKYVPGVIKSLLTGEKRRGSDPDPPAPKVEDVEIRERHYQPGFFNRLVRPGARAKGGVKTSQAETSDVKTEPKPEPKSKTELSATKNSAILSVETVAVEDESEAAPTVKVTEVTTPETSAGGMRVISDSAELFGPNGKAKPATPTKKAAPAAKPSPVVEVASAPKVEPADPAPVNEKIARMEDRVEKMAAEVEASRREREALKTAKEKEDPVVARTVASLQPKPEPEAESVEPEERILPPTNPQTETQLAAVYGDKLSRLESHLISLNEELADARVERARLRKELAVARSGAPGTGATAPPSTTASADRLAPAQDLASARVEQVPVVAPRETQNIPQPEWLKQEVRSVLAAAGEQWEQPPSAVAANEKPGSPVDSAVATTAPIAASPVAAGNTAVTPEQIASTEPTAVPAAKVATPPAPEVNRKPGFFSRLFGKQPEPRETRTTATNLVIVPPSVNDFPGAPTDAQLMGTETRYGANFTQTNFPRIPYQPDRNASFIQPGAGNLTQLPGFPRPQPKLQGPPVREMNQNIRPGPGLRDLNSDENVVFAKSPNAVDLPAPKFKPEVIVVSPPDNSQLAKPVLDLRGMVKSSRRVAQVLVSVSGGSFTPAAGLESWSFQSPVSPGHILVRVKAVNADGVESEIESRSYHFQSRSRLTVKVIGQGTVSPNLNGQQLNVGQPYTVSAQPAPGHEFVGWSGAVRSSEPQVSFVMNDDLWLQAEFRPRAPAIKAGSFTGLVHPQKEIRADRSGSISLQIDAAGNYSGTLQLAGASHPLRGRFDSQWQAAESVARENAEAIALALRIDRGNGGQSITGYFEIADEPVVIRAFRTAASGETVANIRPGNYRLLMPMAQPDAAPGGVGLGEVRVAADGRLDMKLQLPDGAIVTQSTQLSSEGLWPLYVPLQGGQGALTGWISSTDKAQFQLYGEVRWMKPGNAQNPRGFAVSRFVYGGRANPTSAALPRRQAGELVAAAR